MVNKQTAVDYLWNDLIANPGNYIKAYEQAKEMEKQQIENAYLICYEEYTSNGKHWEMGMNPKETFEQYYEQTYGCN
jgi:hypothetical protein